MEELFMSTISRHRWRIGIPSVLILLALLASLAFTISSRGASSHAAIAGSHVISTDPFHNKRRQHQTEVEPDSFGFGHTVVTAMQQGRFWDGGGSDIGFATSTDGGHTFVHGFLPGLTVYSTPAGPYARASDASVAYDPKHKVWLISSLGIVTPSGPVDVVVNRSTDGGLHWSAAVPVNKTGHFNDKNWTACDDTASSPFFGNCYTEFDDNTLRDLIQMSTSTDGGLIWGAGQSTANNTHGIGGQPLVQPNGTVIVPINGFAGNKFLVLSFISTDGGTSWSKTFRVSEVDFRHPAGGIRAGIPLPSAEIDASGTVYVTWSDCRFEKSCSSSDLLLTSSPDGLNWTHPTRIPADPIGSGVDHFIPGLGVDRSTSGSGAHLVAAFYYYPVANCTSATCALQVGYTASADGGASWSRTAQLAGPMSVSWLPNTTQGRMVGDYISTSFSAGVAYPAFAVANPPSGTTFDEAIYTVAGGVSATGSATAATDQDSSTSNATDSSSTDTAQ